MEDNKIVLGKVTADEAKTIEPIIERYWGLVELLMIVPEDKPELKAKIEAERDEYKRKNDEWWADICKKYGWLGKENALWKIDFATFEIKHITTN